MLSKKKFVFLLSECVGALDPVMILNPDHHVTVTEGQSLEVNCTVSDSNQSEKWQKPAWKAQGKVRGTPPQKLLSFDTVMLVFRRVNRSDAGFYKCFYNTSNSTISKGLHIKVDSPSKFYISGFILSSPVHDDFHIFLYNGALFCTMCFI